MFVSAPFRKGSGHGALRTEKRVETRIGEDVCQRMPPYRACSLREPAAILRNRPCFDVSEQIASTGGIAVR